MIVVFAAFAAMVFIPLPTRTSAQADGEIAEQEQAAAEVMEQIETSDGDLGLEEISALGELGPMPWLSYTDRRSAKAVEAWREVAAQLPASDLVPNGKATLTAAPLEFSESEEPGETGGNDTAATGDLIDGFGTRSGEQPVVTITGNLSGADVRPPIEGDCLSVEDDGSIAQANATPAGLQVALCIGEIGDGPFGDSSGDIDFYSYGEVEEGSELILDVEHLSGSLDAASTVIGIYAADGTLLASGEDPGQGINNSSIQTVAPADGEYFGAVAGCCGLPADPTDSSSGPGVGDTGTYEVFMVELPPPCTSEENDGSLAQANPTLVTAQGTDFCSGVLGDGPHGSADGDFYALGTLPVDFEVFVELTAFDNPINAVIGIYNAAGDLVASGETTGDFETGTPLQYAVETEGEYFVAIAGCCTLPSDPTDSASGSASDESGPYGLFMAASAPPCESREDDGSISLANNASQPNGTPDLFEITCFGDVGDGPQAAANGDVDFFRTRPLPADRLLIVDFADFGGSADAGDLTIGVYNSAGDLIGSGQDDPAVSGPASDFFSVTVPADDTYYVAAGGGLPTDANDETSGTNTDIVSSYSAMFIVDTTEEFLLGGQAAWGRPQQAPTEVVAEAAEEAQVDAEEVLEAAKDEVAEEEPPTPVVDTDFFLVDLRKGDAIAGGFDRARTVGILDPSGVQRSGSQANLSFAYPPSSPLRHDRRNGFDHVATEDGIHAVFVTDGLPNYEGELRLVRSGLATESGSEEQIIFLDFDGAPLSGDVFGTGIDSTLSPLSAFLPNWGLGPSDEDAVIDATIDAVVDTLDADLRIRDGRNGDRDASGTPGEFDLQILNSRDHGEQWGQPDVTRLIIGGTIDELLIGTIGLAQSIDPGNTDTEETAVVLLDIMSEPAGPSASINTYGLDPSATKAEFVGFVVGHITGHEIGHVIGNWHQETFNEVEAIMDAGGDFPAIAGVGADGIFGTADDTNPHFVEDVFSPFEGFTGVEDTAGRSAFALSTGLGPVVNEPGELANLDLQVDGAGTVTSRPLEVRGTFTGGTAPYEIMVDWGDGATCPDTGTCEVTAPLGGNAGQVEAAHVYDETGVYEVVVTVTDATGESVTASATSVRCTIFGTKGDDTLEGTSGDDIICGFLGDDVIQGNGGNDIIFGGRGSDRIHGGEGNDTILGGPGKDKLHGGDGNDFMSGDKNADMMWGGDGDDVMNGQSGNDIMEGNGGNDTMNGQSGWDVMRGGDDDDTINGMVGNDRLIGEAGIDTLNGGPGNDQLNGGRGADNCNGGSGANTLISC
jgi:hypothetical protein